MMLDHLMSFADALSNHGFVFSMVGFAMMVMCWSLRLVVWLFR